MLSYNRPEFVRQAVLTCVQHAEYPLEMIVHDDGSDSDTLKVLRELHDCGLISLLMLNAPGNNEGQGIALNRMFHAAKGDPIIKLDHDLIFEPGWLRHSVDVLEANRFACETDAGSQEIGALGLFAYHHEPVRHDEMFIERHESIKSMESAAQFVAWEEHRDFVGSAMVIPRRAWEEFGPFEERSTAFAEDAVFKREISDRDGWCVALTEENMVRNVGFGVGPSTVVVAGEDGRPEPAKIVTGPKVIGRERMAR